MAEARGRAAWEQTSSILALVANVNRDPKKSRAFKPQDFSPYKAVKLPQAEAADLTMLLELFTGAGKGKRKPKSANKRGTTDTTLRSTGTSLRSTSEHG